MAAQKPVRTHGGLEALQEREAVLAELLARPASRFEQPFAAFLVLDRLGAEVERDQEVVGVAEHARAAELTQELDALERLGPTLRDVAERDDQVGPAILQIGECCAERNRVSVHVGEEGNPHSAELMGRA